MSLTLAGHRWLTIHDLRQLTTALSPNCVLRITVYRVPHNYVVRELRQCIRAFQGHRVTRLTEDIVENWPELPFHSTLLTD